MKLNKHARMRARQRVRGESYAQVASDYGVPPQRELGGEGANGFERGVGFVGPTSGENWSVANITTRTGLVP